VPKGPQGQKRPADTVANAIRVETCADTGGRTFFGHPSDTEADRPAGGPADGSEILM
jgi:hypothetical protein